MKPMGENARDDVFGWAMREPGRVTFARQAGSEWTPVTTAEFASQVAAVRRAWSRRVSSQVTGSVCWQRRASTG